MSPALTRVEALYFDAQMNLNDMLAACPDKEARDKVMSRYVALRQNYWTCINLAFHDDDPALGDLVTEADDCADTLSKIDLQLGSIARVIGVLDDAVNIGARIAAKAISV